MLSYQDSRQQLTSPTAKQTTTQHKGGRIDEIIQKSSKAEKTTTHAEKVRANQPIV